MMEVLILFIFAIGISLMVISIIHNGEDRYESGVSAKVCISICAIEMGMVLTGVYFVFTPMQFDTAVTTTIFTSFLEWLRISKK